MTTRKRRSSKITPIIISFENGIEMTFDTVDTLAKYSNYTRAFWYQIFYGRRGIPKMMNIRSVSFVTPTETKTFVKGEIIYKTKNYKIHPRLRSKNSEKTK